MAETNAEKIAICNYRAGRGAKITYHEGDPGTNGANLIATTPASATTTWAEAEIIGGGIAESAGSEIQLTVPASKNVTHFGVWNGSTFLRGRPMDNSVSIGAGAAMPVAFTPRCRYTGN